MSSDRKFTRVVLVIEILSEDVYNPESLAQVAYDIVDGQCSGTWDVLLNEEVDAVTLVERMKLHGSDPGFFGLDEDGHDV